jgi:hypothetical protein
MANLNRPWTAEDDAKLRGLLAEGASIALLQPNLKGLSELLDVA